MANRFHLRWLLPLAVLGIAATLGGCIAYPVYPPYGYGYGGPYYGGGYGWGYGWGYGGGWRR